MMLKIRFYLIFFSIETSGGRAHDRTAGRTDTVRETYLLRAGTTPKSPNGRQNACMCVRVCVRKLFVIIKYTNRNNTTNRTIIIIYNDDGGRRTHESLLFSGKQLLGT